MDKEKNTYKNEYWKGWREGSDQLTGNFQKKLEIIIYKYM